MNTIAGVIAVVIISLCYIVNAADTDTPIIKANLGSSLISSDVKENNDIYITCDIEPNTTSVYKVKWFHDGKEVSTDFKAGIIIADKNLVLQNIKKPTSGNYHCQAITDKGALQSGPIPIDVKNEKSSTENNTTVPPSTEIPTTTINPDTSTDTSGPLERSDLNKDSKNNSSTQNSTTVPTNTETETPTTVNPKNSTTTSSPSKRPGSNKDPKNVKLYSSNNTTTSGTTAPKTTTARTTASAITVSRTTASATTASRTTISRTTTSKTTASRTTAPKTIASRTTTPKTTVYRTTVPANTEIPTTTIPENPNPTDNRFDVPGFNQDFLNDRQPGQNFTKQFRSGDCSVQYERSDRGDTHFTWKRADDGVEMNVRPDGNIGQNWDFPGVQIRLIATSAGEKEQNWNFGPAQYIVKHLPRGGLASRWIVRGYGFGTPIVEDWDTLNFYKNLISAWCDRFYFLVDERDQCIIY